MRSDTGKIFKLEDYKQTDYAISDVHLTFRLDGPATTVTARISFERRIGVSTSAPLELDGDGLKLLSVSVNTKTLKATEFESTPDRLALHRLPSTVIASIS